MLIDLETVYNSHKRVLSAKDWIRGNRRLSLSIPLTIAGVAVEGLWMEISTPIFAVERDVHIMLIAETSASKKGETLERIDWRPTHTHDNKNRGPKDLQLTEQVGSHIHSFSLNWFPDEKRMLEGNLPLAYPADIDSLSFESLFQFALDRFRIAEIGWRLEPPPWQSDLFG